MKSLATFALGLAIATASFCPSTNAADIVDTAVSAGKFNTLAAALKAADLVDVLKGDGPFTVFAPTDDAFAALPPGTVETLLRPENKSKLADILTYHVVPGRVMAAQVVKISGAKTVNGQRVHVAVSDGAVMVDKANVVTTDIQCDNGVIHIIDSVILPADKTIVETASAAGSFTTLLAAAKAAGLAETLGTDGPFTVFAPTDEAFGKIPTATLNSLLAPEGKAKLAEILKYHVVSGRVYSPDALAAKSATTLQGGDVNVSMQNGVARVNDAKLVTTDLNASNGVIHVIDTVLMPSSANTASMTSNSASHSNPRQILHDAITAGVPMYNSGHHGSCASLYEQALMQAVQASPESQMTHEMHSVLNTARHQHNASQRAWTLRHGIDRMMANLPMN